MRDTKSHSDDAVSPVIGVILMVAITVILAAIVGVFVLGIGDDVTEPAQAALQYDGGSDVLVINPGNVGNLSVPDAGSSTNGVPSAGDTLSVSSISDGNTFNVVGTVGGEETVIATYTKGG